MYPSDEHGTYSVKAEWVDAWAGEGRGKSSGWQCCELRQYEDGAMRVHKGPIRLLGDVSRELAALHGVYMLASVALARGM